MDSLTRFTQLYNELLHPDKPLYGGHMLKRAADLFPERTALICEDQKLTFKELYEQACTISAFLQEHGVQPGHKVMILYENSLNFFRAYHAAWQIGTVVIPVNTFMHEKELTHVIQDAQPQVIIVSEKLEQKVAALYHHAQLSVTQKELDLIITTPRECLLRAQDQQALSVLLYTSGTTGLPKGVMLSSFNCIYNSIQGIASFSSRPDDSILCALPLFHSFMQNACIWSACLLGATVIVVPKIDRKALLSALAHQPTAVCGIPQLFGLFCILKKVTFPRVRYFISGGDALPDKIRNYFELVFGRKICNGYGLTETAPFISVDMEDTRSATNCVGRPFIGMECELRDEAGVRTTAEVGTLWVKGKNVMLGYYNAPQATATMVRDGWLNTGDLATIIADGRIFIRGREKDLIIRNGIKIYPQEVENIIMQHPHVTAVGVIGAPHETDGQTPVAYIATTQDIPVAELEALCRNHLAAYKIPRQFIILKELPATSTGKVDKKALRTLYTQSAVESGRSP